MRKESKIFRVHCLKLWYQATLVWWKFRKDGRFCNSIQVIYQNKNERKVDRRADTLDLDTCVERISRYMKGEYVGVVATTYHNNKWSYKQVNFLVGYNIGSSQENSTRSLC